MYQTINFSDFCDAFRRLDRHEQFSYDAKRALFDYLESVGDDTGEKIELDVIALCCDYVEMDLDDVIEQYSINVSDCEDNDAKNETVRDYLNEHTTLIWSKGDTFLFAQF